jgi:hypothetical protein
VLYPLHSKEEGEELMNKLNRIAILVVTAPAMALLVGCATSPKRMEPTATEGYESEFLKGLRVVEQPELEPMWADWVKDNYPHWRKHYWVDRGQWGNRGYIVGRPPAAEAVASADITPLPLAPLEIVPGEPPKVDDAAPQPTKYVVKKGDSLWKIAGKVYGNPLKWPRIYRANKDKIKNPHLIYPNQVLTIPPP